mmetsp:Transcript_10320/g.30438  ORF Transcript_10320/g.30438 Transcript_10320/m.30438 type:complete len:237 (-) Transcript_10320:73-783(-)
MTMAETALSNYAGPTASLFNNMKTPASILGGAMVGLGFMGPLPKPPEGEEEQNFSKKLRKLHHFVAAAAFCSELIAVMWATIAVNQLTESPIAPAESVWHLIQRDFDLEWAAVNAHFILGMFGFMAIVGIRVYLKAVEAGFSAAGCVSIASSVGSGLCLLVSIVNRGVAAGGGNGMRYGATIFSLVTRYVSLLIKRATTVETFGPLELTSLLLAGISVCLGVKEIFSNEKTKTKSE